MMLEDNGPDWNRQYPRYTWTPPAWLQKTIVVAVLAGLLVLSFFTW